MLLFFSGLGELVPDSRELLGRRPAPEASTSTAVSPTPIQTSLAPQSNIISPRPSLESGNPPFYVILPPNLPQGFVCCVQVPVQGQLQNQNQPEIFRLSSPATSCSGSSPGHVESPEAGKASCLFSYYTCQI